MKSNIINGDNNKNKIKIKDFNNNNQCEIKNEMREEKAYYQYFSSTQNQRKARNTLNEK